MALWHCGMYFQFLCLSLLDHFSAIMTYLLPVVPSGMPHPIRPDIKPDYGVGLTTSRLFPERHLRFSFALVASFDVLH